jgi:hypothetical protein
MKSFKGSFIDSGGEVDYFGVVTSVNTPDKILLTDAIAWRMKDLPNEPDFYGYVLDKLNKFHKAFKFDYHVVEKNNIGTTIINTMKFKYKIPVFPITTSNRVTNPKTLQSGKVMNKDETIAWINRLRMAGVIEFPETMTKGLTLLRDQLDNFGAKQTKQGKTVYEALKGNDDLVMALALNVHFSMSRILNFDKIKLIFQGIASDISDQTEQLFPLNADAKRKQTAVKLMTKKGIKFDSIDVKFPL